MCGERRERCLNFADCASIGQIMSMAVRWRRLVGMTLCKRYGALSRAHTHERVRGE